MEIEAEQPLIVAGYDGRPGGDDALMLARILAESLGLGLLGVHAGEAEPADELAAGFERALGGSSVEASFEALPSPSPADALEALALEQRTRLLVVGSTHQTGWGRVHPGAVGERLLGRTACPLAIAPRGFAEKAPAEAEHYLRVLAVGFDGTATGDDALALAAAIAERARGTVRVIAVGHPAPPQATAAAGSNLGASDLQNRLAAAVAELPDPLRAQPIYERGDPAAVLLGHADEGVDLLVIGSRTHSRTGALLLGGTATSLVRQAPCPVLVVPPARPRVG